MWKGRGEREMWRGEGKLEDERLYNNENVRKGNTQKQKHKSKNTKGKTQNEKATKEKTILRGF